MPTSQLTKFYFQPVDLYSGLADLGGVLFIENRGYESVTVNGIELSFIDRANVFIGTFGIAYSDYHEVAYYKKAGPNEIIWGWQKIAVRKDPVKRARKLRLPSHVIERLRKSNRKKLLYEKKLIRSLWAKTEGKQPISCWNEPVKSKITSKFASPRTPPSGSFYYHTGVDLRAPTGTPIRAMGDGKIAFAGPMIVRGLTVVVEHGAGFYSNYYHFSEIKKEEGSYINRGDIIGLSGTTGRSNAPHLHWEIVWKGNYANPHQLLHVWEQICDQESA